MSTESNGPESGPHIFLKTDEVTAMIVPTWPAVDHKWIQSKYESQFEDLGYMDALEYYNAQIDFWQTIADDFEEEYDKEAARAKQTFLSQTLN